jgi:Fungal chitosanase of glycosyl hydrolase group 75
MNCKTDNTHVLMSVRRTNVIAHVDGSVKFVAGMTVDADGSPRAYGPAGTRPLDYLANAGSPGRWWGIATDTSGKPFIQKEGDPYPGYYVSTTSYQRSGFAISDPRRYVDSETVPFIVVPAPLRKMVRGIVLGCAATILRGSSGDSISCVVADFGPATHLGEASIAAARMLEVPDDPKRGGSDRQDFIYTFFPGVPAVVNGETFSLIPA